MRLDCAQSLVECLMPLDLELYSLTSCMIKSCTHVIHAFLEGEPSPVWEMESGPQFLLVSQQQTGTFCWHKLKFHKMSKFWFQGICLYTFFLLRTSICLRTLGGKIIILKFFCVCEHQEIYWQFPNKGVLLGGGVVGRPILHLGKKRKSMKSTLCKRSTTKPNFLLPAQPPCIANSFWDIIKTQSQQKLSKNLQTQPA